MTALSPTNFTSNESNTWRPSHVMTLTSRKLMELPLAISRLFKQHSSQFGIWAMGGLALGIDKVFRSFFHYQGDSQATFSDTERNDRTLEAWTEMLERISRAWKFAAVASAFLFPSSIGLMAIECVLRTRVALVCAIAALLFSVASLTSSFLLATMRPTLQSAQISNLWVEASTNYVQTLSVIEFWTALAFPVWSVAWCIILITTCVFTLIWCDDQERPVHAVHGLNHIANAAWALLVITLQGVLIYRAIRLLRRQV